jgi:uncharacterized protein
MASFDPISAAIGGVVIGLGVVLLMLLTGRLAGVSGIFAEALDAEQGARGWRLAFMVGLITAPLLMGTIGRAAPVPDMPGSWAVVIIGGALVGFGARLGGGCTSGHGLCGVARLSPRSLVATGTFMAAAMVVALSRHALGG